MRVNPVICADYPDPDVLRVGDVWYMISTTMHTFPGGVILRSFNLRDWETAGHVFDRLDDTPAQRLEGGNVYGQGMWAASLRYHEGLFHVLFVANDTHRTYHYTAERVEGPWMRHEVSGFYHDASILFDDDGRVFLASGNRDIRLTQMTPDLSGPLPGGFDGIIVRDSREIPLGYEGSHLQKIGGRYYLSLIHWPGTGHRRRTQAVFRADRIEGPWTGGDVLDDDMSFFNQGVAQGGLVDTPDGRWYAMLFQDRGALGRVPVLTPVAWEDGWPRFASPAEDFDLPDTRPGYAYAPPADSDDFRGEVLRDVWQWNHQPDLSLVRLDPAAGTLTLRIGRPASALTEAKNTLTQRTFSPGCAAEVTLDASGLAPGARAGLCALQGQWAAITAERCREGLFLTVTAKNGEETRETARIPLTDPAVRLRAVFDFRDMRDTVSFFFMQDGAWTPLGEPHHLVYRLDHFMGVRAGLCAWSPPGDGGAAVFSDFRYERLWAGEDSHD